MQIETTASGMRARLAELRRSGRTTGFVPTMGALHAGHLSLVQAARAAGGAVAVSIFVNPTQFGPHEDFSKYPRAFEQDCALLQTEGVELVFAPGVAELYPAGASTFVEVEGISDRLDGRSRPGHFRGVATVVAKLFSIAQPDKAFFGQKDAAQVAVLRRMVRDLCLGVELVVCPTVREPDGLALSSRNRYLTPAERQQALVLSCALRQMEASFQAGERDAAALRAAGLRALAKEPKVRLDYLAVVDAETLEDRTEASVGTLVAIAAWIGTTRLIDNTLLGVSGEPLF